jgi:membrane protease YdiL (CAAX protease family)
MAQQAEKKIDTMLLTYTVISILAIVIDAFIYRLPFLFGTLVLGGSIFAYTSLFVIFYLKLKRTLIHIKGVKWKLNLLDVARFLGVADLKITDVAFIAGVFLLTLSFGYIHQHMIAYLLGLSLQVNRSFSWDVVLGTFLLIPILEEVTYRGILASWLYRLTGGNTLLALVVSSIIFSWTHIFLPEVKLIGSLFFGAIYFCGGRRNLIASIMAHMSLNFVVATLVVVYR